MMKALKCKTLGAELAMHAIYERLFNLTTIYLLLILVGKN